MSAKKIARSVLFLIVPMLFVGCGGYTNPASMPPATAPQLALVANSISNSISIYAVDPQSGQLKAKETVPTGGMNSRVLALESSGHFAYVGNVASNDISVFAIDASTSHLSMVGSPVPAGSGPRIIGRADGEYSLCGEPASQQHHWIYDQSEHRRTDTSHPQRSDGRSPGRATFPSLGPVGLSCQLQSASDGLSHGRLGSLGLLGASPVGLSPSAISMHPSGKFAYVASLASNEITSFSVDQASGALTALTPRVTSGEGPTSITINSQGRFAYVTNAIAGSVSVFAIDVATGALTPRSTVSAGTNPVSLTLDAFGPVRLRR